MPLSAHASGHPLPGGMDASTFLHRYWQKRPWLIRNAFSGLQTLLDRAELFALAGNADVESRLVLEKAGEYPWQVVPGPFSPVRLRRLPKSHWSLLIQGVNFHLERAANLLQHFSFIPNWRVDDLMVSFAPDQGSVGPHLDSYDVFLLQAAGRRRWRISSRRHREADVIPGLDLRILGNFRPDREWLLEPGDMLYLPPEIAHHGIADGESITCSIGFRAPSDRELLGAWLDTGVMGEKRLTDPDLALQTHSGEITARQRRQLRRLARATLTDDVALDRWLGRHLTTLPPTVPAPEPVHGLAPAAFQAKLRRGDTLIRVAACRTAFFRAAGGSIHLFVNGDEHIVPADCAELVRRFTGPGLVQGVVAGVALSHPGRALLYSLYRSGLLRFRD